MATRSQVREVVVQLLYAYGSGNDGILKFVEEILSEQKIKNAQFEFAKSLFYGVVDNIEMLDLRIKHQIKNWDFERIGGMERAILRLGAYEIVLSGVEKAIAINEALELAKSFGNDASAKFVNGILDGIAKNSNVALEVIQEALKEQEVNKEMPQKKDSKLNNDTLINKSKAPIKRDSKDKESKNTRKYQNKNSKFKTAKPKDSKVKDNKRKRNTKEKSIKE